MPCEGTCMIRVENSFSGEDKPVGIEVRERNDYSYKLISNNNLFVMIQIKMNTIKRWER